MRAGGATGVPCATDTQSAQAARRSAAGFLGL